MKPLNAVTTLAPLLFFAYLGHALFTTHGHYNADVVFVLIAAFIGTSACVFKKTEVWDERILNPIASAVFLFFSYLLQKNPGLIHAKSGFAWGGIHAATQLLFYFAAIRMLLAVVPSSKLRDHWLKRVDYVSLMLLFAAKVDVIFASPQPVIDVFTMLNEAIQHFSQGLNPYTQRYTELYAGKYDYQLHFSYWPTMLFILSPFKIAFGDFRFAYIACDLLTCVALWKIATRMELSALWKRGLLLIWLSFPVAFFVLEQAWTDSLLIALGSWLLWACLNARWVTAAILMGFACSTKQYGFVMAWVSVCLITSSAGLQIAKRVTLIAVAVFLLCLLPFVIADATAFYRYTIVLYQKMGTRRDALSLAPALLNQFALKIPEWIRTVSFPLVLAAITFILFNKKEMSARHWGGALLILYGFSFVFLGSAFCNHFYFISFFALVAGIQIPKKSTV